MSLMLGKNISSTCKIRYVRYIALLYEGSLQGTDGIAHHMCSRPLFNLRPTDRPCSRRVDPAPIGRAWPYLDAGPHVERPTDTLQLNVEWPTGARRALSEIGILELLVHGASHPAQTSHADAKNTSRSKLLVTGDDLCHCQHLRGCAR